MVWRLRPGAVLVSLLFWAAGLAIVVLSTRELRRAAILTNQSEIIDARVIDARIARTKHGTSYELRYELTVGGTSYSYGDATGRTHLWASLPLATWSEARRTRTLRVRYAPSDPSINAPDGVDSSSADHYAGFVLAGLIAICTLGFAWWERRALVAGRPSPILNQRRFPGKAMFWRRA